MPATYLLTWNPVKWEWVDLRECIREISRKGSYQSDWNCGNNKRIVKGDRVFLLRQGLEPRGVCGSGYADSDVYEDVHWRESQAKAGRVTRYVRVRWDALLDAEKESILPREWLNVPPLSEVNWNTQISGVRIPDDVAAELEERWAEFLEDRGERSSLFGNEPSAEALR
jgi:5-methylcytosine-specific restriction protein A